MSTCKLEPLGKFEDSEYSAVWVFYSQSGEAFDLLYHKRDYHRVLDYVDRLYDGQTDRTFVSRYLGEAVTNWIEQGYDVDDQLRLEQTAQDFLEKVEGRISDYQVYIPVEGIEINIRQGLSLARCQLYQNSSDSELMQLVFRQRKRWPEDPEQLVAYEQAPAFFKVAVSGHYRQAIERAREEVELAFNVLRLFLGSFYMDKYVRPSTPKMMGLLGTRYRDEHSQVLFAQEHIPIDEQFPGSSVSFRHYETFNVRCKTIRWMESLGLAQINQYLCSLKKNDRDEDVALSLLRAIAWFGKATTASSIAESFLMYAISAEGLLGGGDRTPKEVYALRVAALVVRCGEEGIYPMGGYISKEFDRKLGKANQSDRFNIIRERTEVLFNERNLIAHGGRLEDEIDPMNLLDFETLIRNSILSFVGGGWKRLGEFKDWMDRSITYHFSPAS